MFHHLLRLALVGLVPACVIGTEAPEPSELPIGPDEQHVSDDAVGASIVVPKRWKVSKDPVLFPTHGFFVHDIEGNHSDAVARVALAYDSKAADVEQLVASKLEQYADTGAERVELTLADGRRAVAVTNLPGTDPYTAVFMTDGDRVYEVGLWASERGIDRKRLELLDRLRFREPTQDLRSLGLLHHDDAIWGEPAGELAERNRLEAEQRALLVQATAAEDPAFLAAMQTEIIEPPVPDGAVGAPGCGFTAPTSLYWQLQWDNTNTFYSGTYYNLRERPGWSAMSGNFGSWWGTNYHVGLCYTGRLNQYYANDWPAQHWANAYAAFSGTVEWAGWGTDGFVTLGRYVVVRNGSYRSLTAHLTAIRRGVKRGAHINAYSEIIGWAGDTGGPWDPHLHARVAWGESLTFNGQPYGGQSVRPARLRCFDCTDFDVNAEGAGGFYTSYYHGRWMRY